MRGLSLVAASGGHSSSRCAGLSLSRPLSLRSTGSRHAASVVVAHGLSCSTACGTFSDQGSTPCPLHWQADSQPLHHQGSPKFSIFNSQLFSGICICLILSKIPFRNKENKKYLDSMYYNDALIFKKILKHFQILHISFAINPMK